MKLLYCKIATGNFGDDLNEWLWERAAPGLLNSNDSEILIGIGTLLQPYYMNTLPEQTIKHVLGAGAGSKGRIPPIDSSWMFHGVRGPLTASYFGLPTGRICGDPAIMVARFPDLLSQEPRRGVGFMPHMWTIEEYDWKPICDQLGFQFIDPRDDSKDIIRQISSLNRLLTEAMHGAIVADSVRTPWIALMISPRFEPSKWCDWAGSLGIDIQFRKIQNLSSSGRKATGRLKTSIKNFAIHFGYEFEPYRTQSSKREISFARRHLSVLGDTAEPQLSENARLDSLIQKFEASLAGLVKRVGTK